MAERFSLDSMIFDRIAEREETIALVRRLVGDGLVEFVSTHIQRDELAEIGDDKKRERIARIPIVDVPTYGFVVGVSRLDMARLGPEQPYEAITGKNRVKYAHDALIGMTAQFEGTVLVTEDRRLAKRAALELGVDVWSWQRFRDHLDALDG